MDAVEGKVASILSRTTVAINRGSEHGVSKGDYFLLYTIIGPIRDPETNEDLGTTWKIWGRVIVSIVEKRFCVAETEYEYFDLSRTVLARMFGGTKEQIQLPVNDNQIAGWITKIDIGFRARLEKRQATVSEKKVEALPPKTVKELPSGKEESETESAEYYFNLFPVSGKVINTRKGDWLINLKSFEKMPGRDELHYTLSLRRNEDAVERSLNLWGYREDFKDRSTGEVLNTDAMAEVFESIKEWINETGENSGTRWLFVDSDEHDEGENKLGDKK